MRKRICIFLTLIFLLFLTACSSSPNSETIKVAETYFNAWDEKDYAAMYSLISDGFKVLETTAATEESFAAYAAAQGIDSVEIVSLKETRNTATTATVEYSVVFSVANKKAPYTGTFTLKYKPNDTVPGWKLIHPYGENIDTS